MNWKSMMLCAGVLLAGSTGLVACGEEGEDAPCEQDADCADGEVCIGLEGARECEILCASDDECEIEGEACIQVPDVDPDGATVCDPIELTEDSCESDTDCTAPSTCVDGFCQAPGCASDADCTAPQVCEAGACVEPSTDTCTTTADCVADTAYCAEIGGASSCLDIACGSSLNACGRCELGPNNGARDGSGPVIFFPEQVGGCTQDPNQCLPGAAPFVCEFSFLAFDADDNLATSGLNNRINVISRSGARLSVFGTRSTAAGNNTQYNFKACFPETSGGNIGTAVVLSDSAGDDSQTLCVDGSL